MSQEAVMLVLGIVLAAVGGNLFVRGTVDLAANVGVPAGIIGATVAAFATSSPELAVAVNAALAGTPQVALGDAMGSNVVNLALVLGVALLFGAMRPDRRDIRRDLPIATIAPLLIALLILDGTLGRVDGAVLLVVFAGWLASAVLQARRARDAAEDVLGLRHAWAALPAAGAGLISLLVAGRLIVLAASGIGEALGLGAFLVGATVVALGTSVPELASTLVARLRGHDEVSLGTVLGSNIFNSLWIVGVTALLHPITVPATEVALALGIGVATSLFLIPNREWLLQRWRGTVLLSLYGGYVAASVALHA